MSDSKATYTGRSLRSLLAEGVVIVASILMAFSIDAWWDERQEEDKRQRILGQVREELELYREIVPQAIARADTAIALLDQYAEPN